MSDESPKGQVPRGFTSLKQRDHAAAIGLVAEAWAFFEFSIDHNTIDVLQIPTDKAACLSAQVIGHARKLDAYRAAVNLQIPSDKLKSFNTQIEKLTKDSARLAEQRNRAIHDSWLIDEEKGPLRFEMTARRKLKLDLIEHPTNDIMILYDDINEHIDRFNKLQKNTVVPILLSIEEQK